MTFGFTLRWNARRYTNPNFRPVYYGELVDPSPVGESFRKRYWSRGYVGWDSGLSYPSSSSMSSRSNSLIEGLNVECGTLSRIRSTMESRR